MLSVKIVQAAIYQSILKWVNRLITLVSAIILARLLQPEDFGLMAIAVTVIGLFEGFTSLGLNAGIIQGDSVEREDYDVAWTYGYLIRGLLLFLIIFIISDHISTFYNLPQLALVLKVLSIQQLFFGFGNIWLIEYIREVDYKKDFYISFLSQIFRVLTVVPMAIYFRNIWALVAGILVKALTGLLLQYIFVKKRPKINFDYYRFKKLLKFSIPIIGVQFVTIIKGSADKILLGKMLGISQLGYYQIATRFGFELPSEIKSVVSQIMFPAFSRMKSSNDRLKKGFINVFSLTLIIAIPICTFIFLNASNIILVFLGGKWIYAVPAMKVLVIAGFFHIINSIINPLFKGTGTPKYEFYVSLIQSILAIVLIVLLTTKYGIQGTAYSMLFSLSIPLIGSWHLLNKIIRISLLELFKILAYPFIFGFLVFLISLTIDNTLNVLPWQNLILNFFSSSFAALIMLYFAYKIIKIESIILFIDGIKRMRLK